MWRGNHDTSDANSQPPTQAGAEASSTYTATGVVKAVDKAAKKVTITHDPIPALDWPGMTMGFAVEDASLLDGLKAGDKIRFDFRNRGNTSIVMDIKPRQ